MDGGLAKLLANRRDLDADAIGGLLLDPVHARELGKRGREAIFETFDVNKTAAEIVRTYAAIAQKSA